MNGPSNVNLIVQICQKMPNVWNRLAGNAMTTFAMINIMEEVARYAVVAAEVAQQLEGQFDVIHAHDWLTYFAGL